jgi:PDZ domain-containing secreted protein
MLKKVYNQIIMILEENYKFIFFLLVFYFVLTFPLPYYIHTKGGLINVSDKVKIENEYNKRGSINLSYVTVMNGNVLCYL